MHRGLSWLCGLLGLALVAFPWMFHACTRCHRGVELWVVVGAGCGWGLACVLMSKGWAVTASALVSALAFGHLIVILRVPAKPCLPCLGFLLAGWGLLWGCLRMLEKPRLQALVLAVGCAGGLLGIGISPSKGRAWRRPDPQVSMPR